MLWILSLPGEILCGYWFRSRMKGGSIPPRFFSGLIFEDLHIWLFGLLIMLIVAKIVIGNFWIFCVYVAGYQTVQYPFCALNKDLDELGQKIWIDLESLMNLLSSVSENMLDLESSMVFDTGMATSVRTLDSLVKEARELHSQIMEQNILGNNVREPTS